jgi:hypothetical protein
MREDVTMTMTVRKVHRVRSLILALADKDGRLVRNLAAGVSLPRDVKPEHRYLTHEQTHELVSVCGAARMGGPTYRIVVLFLAYTPAAPSWRAWSPNGPPKVA